MWNDNYFWKYVTYNYTLKWNFIVFYYKFYSFNYDADFSSIIMIKEIIQEKSVEIFFRTYVPIKILFQNFCIG